MKPLVRYWDDRHGFWRTGIVIKEGYRWVIVQDLSPSRRKHRIAAVDVSEVADAG